MQRIPSQVRSWSTRAKIRLPHADSRVVLGRSGDQRSWLDVTVLAVLVACCAIGLFLQIRPDLGPVMNAVAVALSR